MYGRGEVGHAWRCVGRGGLACGLVQGFGVDLNFVFVACASGFSV